MPTPVGWLTRAEMEAILTVPDRRTKRGRSEYALLLFLYNTGARVSEATQLKVRDLQIGRRSGGHDLATLHGKGGKTRQCPLWPETERVLTDEIIGRAAEDAVFVSRLGTPFTRFGVYRLIERCAARVPELADRTITPHVIRHTTACHLVLAGVDINTIRAWLGHVSISTTNIRNRPHAESQRRSSLRSRSATTGSLMEGGQGSHGLSEILVSQVSCCGASSTVRSCSE